MSWREIALESIKREEGFSATSYYDAGFWSVGYGQRCGGVNVVVTQDDALRFVEGRVDALADSIRRVVVVDLDDGQLAALISLAYNIGFNALSRSTLVKKLRVGDVGGASGEFGRWVYVTGVSSKVLMGRRERERTIFLGGV